MTKQTKIMLAFITPTLIVFLAATEAWNPIRWDMFKGALLETAPISFYGQVVDDQRKPLYGVHIELTLVGPNWAFVLGAEAPLTERSYSLITDVQGRFQITGKTGKSVRIKEFALPGFKFKPRNIYGGWGTTFDYAGGGVGRNGPPHSDPSHPEVFEMEPTTNTRESHLLIGGKEDSIAPLQAPLR